MACVAEMRDPERLYTDSPFPTLSVIVSRIFKHFFSDMRLWRGFHLLQWIMSRGGIKGGFRLTPP